MIKNIAHIKFRDSNIGKFEHLHIKDVKVKDNCVIETDDGIELGNVINFEDVDLDLLNKIDEETHKVEDNEDNNIEGEDVSEEIKNMVDKETHHKNHRNKNKIFNIIRIADENDIEQFNINKKDSIEALKICKEKVINHNLDLKLISSYYFLDRAKLLFEFIAEERVDFRELVKDLASHFKIRIELRQIGVRDERC